MRMILTGTGTSHGVPVIGCTCAVCTSADRRDARSRCAAYVSSPARIIIDTGPEFRQQALAYGITGADAVLITHGHADHLNGLDDLRIFSHTRSVDPAHPDAPETEGGGLPIYANARTITDVHHRFDYIFIPVKEGGGKPKLRLIDAAAYTMENPIMVNGVEVVPVPILHGSLWDEGWLLTERCANGERRSIAYLTDCNAVPEESIALIRKAAGTLVHLVIDGLRSEPHSTHFSFAQAMAVAERLVPRHTWLTHITHNMSHRAIHEYVQEQLAQYAALRRVVGQGGSVEPAYDGLVLEA